MRNRGRYALAALMLMVFVALAQGCAAPAAPLPAALDAANAVLAGQAFSEPFLIEDAKALELLGLSAADAADTAMYMDVSRMTPECVVVVTAPSDAGGGKVRQALSDYRQMLKAQYESYRPDEVYKVDQAVLESSGRQHALVISPSPQDARTALNAAWKK
ncbi:MAG TPA: DUF4358 domain-containing protein [Candidatus Limnocylindria bacterium]|nr:DUF4358 domain-containing protein [Candidatus Limnocylindria bacterium]